MTDAAEIRRLAAELRAAPHLMIRDDLDRAAELLDSLADAAGVTTMVVSNWRHARSHQ